MAATTTTTTTESNSEILHEFLFFNVHKDGRVTVFSPPIQLVPAVEDPTTGVNIKDVKISGDISARLFLPPPSHGGASAVLLYVHGGGFCMQSAFSSEYTSFLTRLSAAGNLIAFSVEYSLFPRRHISASYDDSWAALRWIAAGNLDSHYSGGVRRRLFIAGDSAGGNICHTLAVRAGSIGLGSDVAVEGMVLVHPYFGEDDRMWMYMCGPGSEGPRDRRMRPDLEDLARLGCRRVLVLVAEKDGLRNAGVGYVDELRRSGWGGTVEFVENREKDHCFHLGDPQDEEAVAIQDKIIQFINHDYQD